MKKQKGMRVPLLSKKQAMELLKALEAERKQEKDNGDR